MKRNLLFFIFLFSVLGSRAQSVDTLLLSTYNNTTEHVSFKYPAVWDTLSGLTLLLFSATEKPAVNDDYKENMLFSKFPFSVDASMDMNMLLGMAWGKLVRDHNGTIIQKSTTVNPAGITLYACELSYVMDGVPIDFISAYFKRGTALYSIGFTSKFTDIEKYRKLYNTILNSIQ